MSMVDKPADMVDVDDKLVDPGIEVEVVYAPGEEGETVELESDTEVVEIPATEEDEDDRVLPELEDIVELEVVPTLDDGVTELLVTLLLVADDGMLLTREDEVELDESPVLDVVVTMPGDVVEDEDLDLDVEDGPIRLDDRDDEDTELELEVEGELIMLDDEDDEDTELELEVEDRPIMLDDSDDEDDELELEVVVIIIGGSDDEEELVVTDLDTLFVFVRLVELIMLVELELEDPVELSGGPAE
jgi:hypothetical protein